MAVRIGSRSPRYTLAELEEEEHSLPAPLLAPQPSQPRAARDRADQLDDYAAARLCAPRVADAMCADTHALLAFSGQPSAVQHPDRSSARRMAVRARERGSLAEVRGSRRASRGRGR